MSKNRKQCKQCPWLVRNKHNDKMLSNINRFVNSGCRKNTEHKCHMIDTNLWSKVTENNVCIGSISKP